MNDSGNSQTDIQYLVIRHLEGTASDEELLSLQSWLSLSKENFSLFVDFKKHWLEAGADRRYDVNSAWTQMEQRLELRKSKQHPRFWIKVSSCAAAILLLVTIGYYGLEYHSDQQTIEFADGKIEPGSNKAILVLGSNRKVELSDDAADSLIMDGSIVKNEGNTLVYSNKQDAKRVEEYNTLITPRGGEYTVVLADGTQVWLNSESELRYPVHFSDSVRKVYLKGEAYFHVTKQQEQKFVVCSDRARITVFGTEFNVRNYEDAKIATTLVKGSVVVAHANGKECKLVPGQQAVIEHEKMDVRKVEPILYTAWKDGFFVYQDKTLDDILMELSRWYDFTYFYQNKSLEKMVLTAKLKKFDSVSQIFEVLSETDKFKFIIKGKTVTVVAK